MLIISRRLGAALLFLAALFASGCAGQPARVKGAQPSAEPIRRTLLSSCDLPDMPGWELRLYLIEYAPGAAAPLHHHPVEGLGYVITGAFESAFDKEQPIVKRAGESFQDLRAIPHVLFRNPDKANPLEFVIAYVVPRGAPVVTIP
jgi:quercetin dioxygenase-like cupin family protein